jgi:hypothetical protein
MTLLVVVNLRFFPSLPDAENVLFDPADLDGYPLGGELEVQLGRQKLSPGQQVPDLALEPKLVPGLWGERSAPEFTPRPALLSTASPFT